MPTVLGLRVKVATICWGRMIELFDKYVWPSLKPDIDSIGADFALYANQVDFFKELRPGEVVFVAPPDTVWGAGSLKRMTTLMEMNEDMVLAVPHFRVDEERFIEVIKDRDLPLSCTDLMDIGFYNGHQNFERANVEKQPNVRHSGVSVKHVDDEYSVIQHSLPTISMLQVSQSDINFFNGWMGDTTLRSRIWGTWDRDFLRKVSEEGRLGVIGSSEFACNVELTPRNSHLIAERHNYNSSFTAEDERMYNRYCRQSLFVMKRGKFYVPS